MKQNTHNLRCPNQQCNTELTPIGNYSYRLSRLVRRLRKYTLISTPIFVIALPLMGIMLGYVNFIFPFAFVFLLTALFPKTTVISCHKCRHQSEHRGKIITPPPLPKAQDKTLTNLTPNEVVDHSIIDLEEFQLLSKEKAPVKHLNKKRLYRGNVIHKPSLRGKGYNDFGL